MFQNQTLKTIKYIVNDVQWDAITRSPWWFISIHLPYIITCILQAPFRPHYKNLYFNSRIYDGLSRNGFKKGRLIEFLFKVGAIKQPKSWADDPDHRAYWIGSLDDNED